MVFFQFLTDYAVFILPSAFAVLLLFAAVNWLVNPYRRVNARLNACRRKIASYPDKTAKFVSILPQEYQRQWRAYVNANADKPSLTFEFVKRPARIYLLRLLVLDTALLICYVVAFFLCAQRAEYFVCLAAFAAFVALTFVLNNVFYRIREKRARKVFGKFVAELNAANVKRDVPEQDDLRKTLRQLHELNKGDVTKTTLNKAADLLRAKGLENNRTVEEQRKLNTALNGLLQAYARNAKLNPQ